MRERRTEFERLDTRVVAVTFESQQRVREYRERESLDFPILRDPGRRAYRAFGIERKSIQRIWSPRTIWYYLRQSLRGRLPHIARSDYYQLGGDVLLSAAGEVCWVYHSREPADRPSVDTILKELRDCARD